MQSSIHILSSYSLVKFRGSPDAFFMHPMIHFWAKERLLPGMQQQIAGDSIRSIARGLRHAEESLSPLHQKPYEKRIVPHLDAAVSNVQAFYSTNVKIETDTLLQPWGLDQNCSTCLFYKVAAGWYLWAWAAL